MLVVLALVALLSSMVTAVIVMARRFSIRVECQEHERQIGQTLNALMLSNGGLYPALKDANDIPWWANIFAEWAGSESAKIDTDPGTAGLQLPSQLPKAMETFHCRMAGALDVSSEANLKKSISYGIHFDLKLDDADKTPYECTPGSNTLQNPPATAADKHADAFYYTEIEKPSEFILLSETDTQSSDPTPWTGGRISMGVITRDGSDDPPDNAPIVGRHGGFANVLFADMHVAPMQVDGQSWPTAINGNTRLWTLPDEE